MDNHPARRILPAALSAVLLLCCALLYPGACRVVTRDGSREQLAEFSDWRGAIAPESTVFVVPATIPRLLRGLLSSDPATSRWISLRVSCFRAPRRSSATPCERAPAVMEPDWRLYSGGDARRAGADAANGRGIFTRNSLVSVCGDPLLGFVVARQELGFDRFAIPTRKLEGLESLRLPACAGRESSSVKTILKNWSGMAPRPRVHCWWISPFSGRSCIFLSWNYLPAATTSFLIGAIVAYELSTTIAFKQHRLNDRRRNWRVSWPSAPSGCSSTRRRSSWPSTFWGFII